jgi:hypothetical protein
MKKIALTLLCLFMAACATSPSTEAPELTLSLEEEFTQHTNAVYEMSKQFGPPNVWVYIILNNTDPALAAVVKCPPQIDFEATEPPDGLQLVGLVHVIYNENGTVTLRKPGGDHDIILSRAEDKSIQVHVSGGSMDGQSFGTIKQVHVE